jgi:SAM-dependent methyltransferase
VLPLQRQNEYRRRYAAHTPGWQASGDLFEALVRQSITPTTRLLDLGGGRGGLVEKIHPLLGAATTLDPDLLSLLEHRAQAVARVVGWAQALPFPNQHFDLVTATWLLEHLADPNAVFSEVQRVLVPGGRFIFLTPNALHPLLLANRLSKLAPALQRKLVPRLYARAEADTFPVQYKANTSGALQALCGQHGFALGLHLVADPTYTAFNEPLFRLSTLAEHLIPSALRIHIVGVAVKTK